MFHSFSRHTVLIFILLLSALSSAPVFAEEKAETADKQVTTGYGNGSTAEGKNTSGGEGNAPVGAADTTEVDRLSPDFVHVSVIIAEPHDILYSSFGHSALRLTCPTYHLDYIFTCEGEAAQDNITRFLLGKLKMGVYAMKPEVFLKDYRRQGRRVMEYELNLPAEAKQRLWQEMDERAAAEPVPYDFITNGCTHLVLRWIEEALQFTPIEYGAWPESFSGTRKEISGAAIEGFAWNHFIIGTMIDGRLNDDCDEVEKVIVPSDLVYVLSHAKLNGEPIIKGEREILKGTKTYDGRTACTPMAIALAILIVTLALLFAGTYISNSALYAFTRGWIALVLALHCAIGLFLCYLVYFTSLPGTEWNWLLVVVNPLPAILWRWRSKWTKCFFVLCVAWCAAALSLPFIHPDAAYYPFVLAVSLLPFLRTKKLIF